MSRAEVKRVTGLLERFTEKIVVNVATEVTNQLFDKTPVKTGYARSNWIPSIGSPVLLNLSGVEPTVGLASASRGVQNTALAGLKTYKLGRGNVFIVNNVTYITDLNRGSSRQAPAAFVQRAIAVAIPLALRGLSRI